MFDLFDEKALDDLFDEKVLDDLFDEKALDDLFEEKVLDDLFDGKVLDMTETKVDAVLNFARNVFVDTALKVSLPITFLDIYISWIFSSIFKYF